MKFIVEDRDEIPTAEDSYHPINPAGDVEAGQGLEAARSCSTGGDLESRNRLVQANLGLVYHVARQYMHRGLTFDDLVGEGNLGLIRAAQNYDPAIGTQFSTYATYWIREAIQSALANTAGTIRLPMNVSKLLGRWRRTERLLLQRQGHPPTFEEVATSMGLDHTTQRLVDKAHRVARLHKEAVNAREDLSLTLLMLDEGVSAEELLSAREEHESIARRLERLGGMERAIVSLRFGLSGEPPMTFDQISGRLGVTTTEVQKAVSSAMRKLGRHHATHFRLPEPARESRVG
jgi:RNA polymerase primary sigma factor